MVEIAPYLVGMDRRRRRRHFEYSTLSRTIQQYFIQKSTSRRLPRALRKFHQLMHEDIRDRSPLTSPDMGTGFDASLRRNVLLVAWPCKKDTRSPTKTFKDNSAQDRLPKRSVSIFTIRNTPGFCNSKVYKNRRQPHLLRHLHSKQSVLHLSLLHFRSRASTANHANAKQLLCTQEALQSITRRRRRRSRISTCLPGRV